MDELDEIDQAFIGSFTGIPENAVITSLFSIVTWLDPETGETRYKLYSPFDAELSTTLGLLEMAKFEMLYGNTEEIFGEDDDA